MAAARLDRTSVGPAMRFHGIAMKRGATAYLAGNEPGGEMLAVDPPAPESL
jgi:hypothetical protein